MKLNHFFSITTSLGLLMLTACNQTGASATQPTTENSVTQSVLGNTSDTSDTSDTSSTETPTTETPAPVSTVDNPPAPIARNYKTDALVYGGNGSWGTEVSSLKNIMNQNKMTYDVVSSAEMDAMSVDDFAQYGMIVWPGGYGGTQANSLSSKTHANLRAAVQERGVSYIGFCAGSFVAVAPAPAPGKDVSYGLGIVNGPILDYYYLENQGVEADMTMATFADGTKRDILWYGGPVTPNTPGTVVAKYPNGDAMISEMWSGKGFVVLSAVHPTAPDSVKSSFGLNDSDGNDFELTYKLLQAALHQQPLPTF